MHRLCRDSFSSAVMDDVDINTQLEEERAAFHESHRTFGIRLDTVSTM